MKDEEKEDQDDPGGFLANAQDDEKFRPVDQWFYKLWGRGRSRRGA